MAVCNKRWVLLAEKTDDSDPFDDPFAFDEVNEEKNRLMKPPLTMIAM